MDEIGIKRCLPAGFAAVTAHELSAEMKAEANAAMRNTTLPDLSDGDLFDIATKVLSLPTNA